MTRVPLHLEMKMASGDREMVGSEGRPEGEEEEEASCCRQVGLARMTAQQVETWQHGLLEDLPKLNAKEIRRYRLKHHIWLCLELDEDGFPESAAYVRYLLQLNTDMRKAAGKDSLLWRKPKLRDNDEFLERLRTGLMAAESAQQQGRLGEQNIALVDLAVFFMKQEEAWWWLSEQLFLWAVSVSEEHKADGGKREAITKYIYGMFLLCKLDDVEGAMVNLQTARKLSTGQDWTAGRELGQPQSTVFRESCSHLYKALILAAQQLRETNPSEAIRLCSSALRRAQDSERQENEAEALYELGLSYQVAGEEETALEVLIRYMRMCRHLHDAQGICNAHLEMAICYKNLADGEATRKHLEEFLRIAEENFLLDRRAEANRYLGEYHLNVGNYGLASTHFSASFSLYYGLDMPDETEQVRALQGIAAGHELLPAYANMVLRAHQSDKDMAKLIRWKEVHKPFLGLSVIAVNSEELRSESGTQGSEAHEGEEEDKRISGEQAGEEVEKVSGFRDDMVSYDDVSTIGGESIFNQGQEDK